MRLSRLQTPELHTTVQDFAAKHNIDVGDLPVFNARSAAAMARGGNINRKRKANNDEEGDEDGEE